MLFTFQIIAFYVVTRQSLSELSYALVPKKFSFQSEDLINSCADTSCEDCVKKEKLFEQREFFLLASRR